MRCLILDISVPKMFHCCFSLQAGKAVYQAFLNCSGKSEPAAETNTVFKKNIEKNIYKYKTLNLKDNGTELIVRI